MADVGDTRIWDAIMSRVRKLGNEHVRVGVLASHEGDAPHGESGEITMSELAAIHEFGSPAAGIPERSFIRRTFRNAKPWLPAFTAKLAKAVIDGKMTEHRALEILGTRAVSEVRKTITGPHIPPPLKPATVARKGSDRPLVDTGRLLGAISYDVLPGPPGTGGAE